MENPTKMIYHGWMIFPSHYKELFESYGIHLIRYHYLDDRTIEADEVEFEFSVLEKLDPYWGDVFWGVDIKDG